jgi:hypothetical protein
MQGRRLATAAELAGGLASATQRAHTWANRALATLWPLRNFNAAAAHGFQQLSGTNRIATIHLSASQARMRVLSAFEYSLHAIGTSAQPAARRAWTPATRPAPRRRRTCRDAARAQQQRKKQPGSDAAEPLPAVAVVPPPPPPLPAEPAAASSSSSSSHPAARRQLEGLAYLLLVALLWGTYTPALR